MRKTAKPSNTIATALLYVRVSGGAQEREGLCRPAQLAECQRYAREPGWIIGGPYRSTTGRPPSRGGCCTAGRRTWLWACRPATGDDVLDGRRVIAAERGAAEDATGWGLGHRGVSGRRAGRVL